MLAQLFIQAEEAAEFEREEIINKVTESNLVRFGIFSDTVVMELKDGRMIAESRTIEGCPIVEFDWYPNDRVIRKHFWFNASSVKNIGEMLRNNQQKKAEFNAIFFGMSEERS